MLTHNRKKEPYKGVRHENLVDIGVVNPLNYVHGDRPVASNLVATFPITFLSRGLHSHWPQRSIRELGFGSDLLLA
jgi:hypothetical protein